MTSPHPLDKRKAEHDALLARFDNSPAMQEQHCSQVLHGALRDAGADAIRLREIGQRLTGDALSKDSWLDPQPLPAGLPAVQALDPELLPDVAREFVFDIAERMQCPVDFPAAALMVVVSSMIGRRCGIMPKMHDDWTVIPNLWGMCIGRPGIMKSPPMAEVMRLLSVLSVRHSTNFVLEKADHAAQQLLADEAARVAKDAIRKAIKAGHHAEAQEAAERAHQMEATPPTCRRYIVNDCTVEKLGELLNENPMGLLHFRDELTAFFKTLERQGHEADRAFYLECWNGNGSHTYDRIGRGTIHVEAACLSMLGSIQPGPLSELVRNTRGTGDDGLIQRFQLAVWPDASPAWKNIDRPPNYQARERMQAVIERLDAMTAERIGADAGSVPVLRFDTDAQALFDAWRERLEHRLRDGSEHPAMEAHLSKFRSLIPSLALILHLMEHADGPVTLLALERAIGWALYLESHARRIYSPAINPDVDAARLLAVRITKRDVPEQFTLRDVYRNGWAGLSTVEQAQAAVNVLVDFDWLRVTQMPTDGRTKTIYTVSPKVLTMADKQ